MSYLNPRNQSEASDSLANLTAAATGLAALVYSANVLDGFVSASAATFLGYGQIVGGLLILGVFGPLMFFFKSRGGRPTGKPAAEGYLQTLFRQAGLTAFSLTIVFMIALSIFDRTVLARVTSETAIDLVITFALAIFAISFFAINRFSRGDVEFGDQS